MREDALVDVSPPLAPPVTAAPRAHAPRETPHPSEATLAGCQIWIRYPSGRFLTYEFDRRQVYLGRGEGNDVRLAHPFVSTRHLMIETVGNRHQVTDLGSLEGSRVNGQPLEPMVPHPLCDQDRIELGPLDIAIETVFDATVTDEPEPAAHRPTPRWITTQRRVSRSATTARDRGERAEGRNSRAWLDDAGEAASAEPLTSTALSSADTRGGRVLAFHQPPQRPIDIRWSIALESIGVFVAFAALTVFVVIWFL